MVTHSCYMYFSFSFYHVTKYQNNVEICSTCYRALALLKLSTKCANVLLYTYMLFRSRGRSLMNANLPNSMNHRQIDV